jgi:peptide/nickel transport system ATP-binding protein
VVEHGTADDVLLRPTHPYTQQLVASLPELERPAKAAAVLAEGRAA